MQLRKNLYYLRFAHHNPHSNIKHALQAIFPKLGAQDQWIHLDSHTYMVYSEQDQRSVYSMIGMNFADELDDFFIMLLDFDVTMSTFTDRQDVITFLKFIKQDCQKDEGGIPSEEDINVILDKISRLGQTSLTPMEIKKLSQF